MSLFRPYNYKPTKGVDKNAPQKNGFFVFWEIYFRKFWRFLEVNLIYFVVTLPMLMYFFYIFEMYMAQLLGDDYSTILIGVAFFASLMDYIPQWLFNVLLAVSVLLYGPVKMGVTYVYRNFAREEHAWLSDIFDRAKKNLGQGLFFGILDFLVTVLLLNNIIGSFTTAATAGLFIMRLSKYLSIFVLVIYGFMRHYFYILAVTVKLSIGQIIRNSWLFVIIGFGRNILTSLICMAVWLATLFILPLVTVVALLIMTYSLCGFATVYVCYPVVKKYVVLPAMEEEEKQKPEPEKPEDK